MVLYFLLGVVISGPLWLLAARWLLRRTVQHTRRIAAAARRQEHLVELGTLTGGLAHEIKNPLSTIKVNLQLLSEDLDSPTANDQQRRWLRRLQAVSAEAARLQEVLDDFLRLAGRHDLRLVRTDLREVIGDLSDFFSPQATSGGIRVRTSAPAEAVWVRADVGLLKQAILNLMINAQQAMEPGGGELMLRVEAARSKARIEVIDTGPGIPPEKLGEIFGAYYTTKRGGTGLGLATAQRIVREHEGQISVDSTPGAGTRFVIQLPLAGEKDR